MRKKKTVGILVLVVMMLSLWSAGVLAVVVEYPIMIMPGGAVPLNNFGQQLDSLFNSSSEKMGQTITEPVCVKAQPAGSSVIINGTKVSFEAYAIDSRTYFKLRDLAKALNGSGKQFEVSWDGTKNAINLLTDKPYSASGAELTFSGNTINKNATLSTAKVYINGIEASLTAYEIDGLTYFKLRDLGRALNFSVSWGGATSTISIDTTSNYVPE